MQGFHRVVALVLVAAASACAASGGAEEDSKQTALTGAERSPCALRIVAPRDARAGVATTATLAGTREGSGYDWQITETSCLAATPPPSQPTLTFTPSQPACTLHLRVRELPPPNGGPQVCEDTAVVQTDFSDVTEADGYHASIDLLAARGISHGCGGGNYCPSASTTRGQMAVFLLASKEGPGWAPPACNPQAPRVFEDVPATRGDCAWIEELAKRSITVGCGTNLYCPDQATTREQMAVFLLRTHEGTSYRPPACIEGQPRRFSDVPAASGFCPWVEELARRGITGGCAPDRYCPQNPVSRAQMAVFDVATFGLTFPED